MSERINQERKRFEAWAESMSHERSTERHRASYLPADIARCPGVGYPSEDEPSQIDWREGCEHCLRRTAPSESEYTQMMQPPIILVFECEYLIEPTSQ